MKKMIQLSAALALVLMLGSCKKDYVCKCTKTYTGGSATVTIDDGNFTYKENKVNATEKCDANEKTGSDIGGDYTRNCEIQ